MKLNPIKVGLGLGAFIIEFHLLWIFLVAAGVAQQFVDFMFDLLMIAPFIEVQEFSAIKALYLVIVISIIGFVVGWVFAKVWNKVMGKK